MLLSSSAIIPVDATAQVNQDRLNDIQRRIDKGLGRDAALSRQSEMHAASIQSIRHKVVQVARRLQLQEAAMMRVELRLAALENNVRVEGANYRQNERQFLRIIGALRRVQSNPPGVLAMQFSDAQDAIRSMIVLRALVPQLKVRAEKLRRKLVAYHHLRNQVSGEKKEIAARAASLRKTRLDLAALLGRQNRLLNQTQEEKAAIRRRLDRLTKKARTVQDLISGIKREKSSAKPGRPVGPAALTKPKRLRRFHLARGQVSAPVSGRVARTYGSEDQYGLTVSGIRFIARAGAQVVAPYDGQIVFAGPFRSYGQILIIKHTDGYHSLVAGLARIDVVNRQWVLADEPVGIVGADSTLGARLYLELRQDGRPINPQPWLAVDKRKVDG
ncbi:MAG: peptidoglycan DD-metalloendopeptidase family protein [Rhodospirillaceae bacterium]|nr:peptidoglycan DD-metalloendopeptidase family protein [Rhodospirillaceae bacterium]